MRSFFITTLICCTLLLLFEQAVSANRTALVIGNADYQSAPLKNPVNDARDMADSLRKRGFSVIYAENADRNEMRRVLREFSDTLVEKKGAGLFYFAGHGVQLNGKNYLIPVGADINREYEVQDQAIRADLILQAMAYAGNELNIVILDACRNNPYPRSFRSVSRGLARMETINNGMIIAYATSPGSVAQDGDGDNGIYTKHLLKAINTPGLTIEQVFKHVRHNVIEETGKEQTPWEESSLTGDFYFLLSDDAQITVNVTNPASTTPAISAQQNELIFWKGISESGNVTDFKEYLRLYPEGVFADLARQRVVSLPETADPVAGGAMATGSAVQGPVGYWLHQYREENVDCYIVFSFMADGTGSAEGADSDGSWWAEPIRWEKNKKGIALHYHDGNTDEFTIERQEGATLILSGSSGDYENTRLVFTLSQPKTREIALSVDRHELVGSWKETWEDDGRTAYQIYSLQSDRTALISGWESDESWKEEGKWSVDESNTLEIVGEDFRYRFSIVQLTKEFIDLLDQTPGSIGMGARYFKVK